MDIKEVKRNTYRKTHWYEKYDEECCMAVAVLAVLIGIFIFM